MFEILPDSEEEMRSQMLANCITSLKLNTFLDNYDAERFSFDGVDRSTNFNGLERAYWFNWFIENISNIYSAFLLFSDESSKRLYLTIIAYKLAGFHSVKIPVDFLESGSDWDDYCHIESGIPSQIPTKGMFGKLRHYDFRLNGKRYIVDCLGLKYYLYRKQYFYNKNGIEIMPSKGDFVIDGGACLGDTAVVFANAVGETGCVYAFDPVLEHIEILSINAKQNPNFKIIPIPFGLSNIDHDFELFKSAHYNPGFQSGGSEVPLRSIDSLVIDGEVKNIDFIKLDIEGAELSALKGATGSIRKFKPKLAISLYHKPNDIFEIPIFISSNFENYDMHLGHYTIHHEETVLYCKHNK